MLELLRDGLAGLGSGFLLYLLLRAWNKLLSDFGSRRYYSTKNG